MTEPDTIYGELRVQGRRKAYVGTIVPSITGTSNAACTGINFTVTPGRFDGTVHRTASNVVLGTITFRSLPVDHSACKAVTVYLKYTLGT